MRKYLFFLTMVCLMVFLFAVAVARAQTNSPPPSAASAELSELAAEPVVDMTAPSGKAMLSAILFAIGAFLKKSPMKDWMIPFAIVFAGAIIACLLDGFDRVVIVRGIYCGCGAVTGHQLIKQLVSERKDAAPQSVTPTT